MYINTEGHRMSYNDELIGIQEAANRCGVHYRTLRRWVAEGRINAVRVGPRLLKVAVADLDSLKQPVGGGAK
jgi:excisionase family DNA binding protein